MRLGGGPTTSNLAFDGSAKPTEQTVAHGAAGRAVSEINAFAAARERLSFVHNKRCKHSTIIGSTRYGSHRPSKFT